MGDDVREKYRIWNGNFAEYKWPQVDGIFTDPPYGNFYKNSRKTMFSNGKAAVDGDNMEWLETFPNLAANLCLVGPVVMFCDRHRRSIIEAAMQKAGFNFINDAVWVKSSWGIGYNFRPAHEHILLFSRSKTIKATHASLSSVLKYPRVHISVKKHMTEKPVALMAELILGLTKLGSIIMDPFMGVASTGVACLENKRKFVGTELRNDYYEIGKARLQIY